MPAEKKTGKVKFFNNTKGFGFITPDDGTEDLFVHQTSVHAKGYRSLADGETVEFDVEVGDDGRTKAMNVTGPDGSYVQGQPREQRQERSYGGGYGQQSGGDRW
ncbi:CSD domain-containing protein [Plasmodiophora brassicae]|uniref:CSD domain-containing protein n=1 Tax=Plasmodiophora brassicae TaxID=37360 RepID=A0A0G4IH19_PLABS|nr:hypothetical protein PBRA_000180 [Plasmodiophora brassicae]SPQ96744.1 unnamed protein product [Plasmodiophora brassicae]